MVRNANTSPTRSMPLVAKQAEVAADGMSVTFWLDEQAAFSDGHGGHGRRCVFHLRPAERKTACRNIPVSLQDVEGCTVEAAQATYAFKGSNVRDLPLTVARCRCSRRPITANEFNKTTLEPPLGSGPYKVKELNQGSFITYELREDWWAKDLPVNRGRYNFDEIKLLYFRDRTPSLKR